MKNLFDVSGKVAVVTGGSTGIGRMITQGFVENGLGSRLVDLQAEGHGAEAQGRDFQAVPAHASSLHARPPETR